MTQSATVTPLSTGYDEAARQVVAKLRATFDSGRTRPIEWRKQQLTRLIAMLVEHEAEIEAALKGDLGKSGFETALSETGFIISEAKFALKHLARWMRPKRVGTPIMAQPGRSRIQPEPKGVVLIIAPWNYPLSMVLAPLVGVIAAGNTAVMKPSEVTSHTSALIAKLVPQYLDVEAFAVIEGGVPQTSALLEQRFDHIIYTGNETVARIVMLAAAKHLTPVTLELGGKSPCLIDASADLEVAVSRIAWGKFVNAGQTCVAPDHVYVHRRIADEFIVQMRARLRQFYGEDAAQSPDYCRIASERHTARFEKLLAGQTIVHGGRIDVASRYVEPTLVLDPHPESALMQEEIFGPVLPINVVDRIDAVIEPLARRPKPLALYLFARNAELEQAVLARISAGSVCINDTMMFMASPLLPFGGIGNSGMGRYTGWFGFETFSHMKPVMKRSYHFDVDVRYPPYTERKAKLLRMMR
jgi:aldehyde dehydrogenase (NAD+)